MRQDGWHVAHVDSMEDLVKFAKAFSLEKYHKVVRNGR
jgi:hypothetical protein